eukprot:TRINITY_DN3856_c0_g1_i1.p1 TRINITY_DN3856_c0_g1~~TRINITY_DN3856_c0_g1_i1.p1  ORF type:complete len:255 (-),score=53.39 TRINITY_DN3856_c0_g1_i1:162-926(-)
MSMSTDEVVANGARVRLCGLSSGKYNGLEGICRGVAESGRYIIEIKGENQRKLVKRDNLEVIPNKPKAQRHSAASQAFPADMPHVDNASWAKGLDKDAAAEWFVDCYRMRVDDEYTWLGNHRGLYVPDNTKKEVLLDFLLFCNLAIFNGVIPKSFDWGLCLSKYGHMLNYAFEKSDAQEKYGRENVFAVLMGGRSLRATGEAVTGRPIGGGNAAAKTCAEEERLEHAVEWEPSCALFEQVGGFAVWSALLEQVL